MIFPIAALICLRLKPSAWSSSSNCTHPSADSATASPPILRLFINAREFRSTLQPSVFPDESSRSWALAEEDWRVLEVSFSGLSNKWEPAYFFNSNAAIFCASRSTSGICGGNMSCRPRTICSMRWVSAFHCSGGITKPLPKLHNVRWRTPLAVR